MALTWPIKILALSGGDPHISVIWMGGPVTFQTAIPGHRQSLGSTERSHMHFKDSTTDARLEK